MRLLELFSGTGSVGKAFREQGWEVISLDIKPRSGADIIADILSWDYTIFEKGHFDAVWGSPCCTHFSRARTTAKTPRNLVWADSLVSKTLEIIDYFQPKICCFESPQTGLLKNREVARGIPDKDVSYCSYGYSYRKYTRLWTNSEKWAPRLLRCKANPCDKVVNCRRLITAQRRPSKGTGGA